MKIHRSLAAFITILFIICLITPAQAAWDNINSLVEITESDPVYSEGTASVTITITNTSGDIAGDIRLIVSGIDLPINPDGITDEGGQDPSPYYDITTGHTGLMEVGESSTVVMVFSAAEGDSLDYTLNVEINDDSMYRDIFRKNISRAPEEFSGAGMIKVMSVYVDGRSSKGRPYVDCNYYDCNSVTFDTVNPDDVIQVKPLIVTYEQEIEDAAFNPVPDHTDEVTLARDVIAAVSYDDGATWKRSNISKTAGKSSFELDNGVAYLGDSEKIDFTVEGDCVFITWVDKYARSGNPWDLDANYDYYQIMGPQRSVDYLDVHGDDDPRPDLGQKPFSALYGARGYLDPNLGQIVWFKGDQITTGRNDAVRNYTAGLKDGGFAVSWQEDPKGLKTGKGMGPGAGMSGACVHHKTDLWYSYIEWKDFAVEDPNFVPSGGDDGVPLEDGGYTNYTCPICYYVYDPTENLDEAGEPIKFADLPLDWTCPICTEVVTKALFVKENRPHALIKMSPPVRVTDNAVCKDRTPEDVWGYACPYIYPDGTLCGYTFSDGTGSNGLWTELPADWFCPKCELATKTEFIGPVVVMEKHTGGLWCAQFADGPRVDRDGNLLLSGDLGYEFGFYTYEAWVMDPNGNMTLTTIPLDGDTGASRPAIALVKSLEDPNQTLVVMAYEETKGIGSGSDKVAMASEQEAPVPELFVDSVALGGLTNQDCVSCHYSYLVPRDRINSEATTIEACNEIGGTWDESIDAYWPPLSTDGYIEISAEIPDGHPTNTNCSACHSGEENGPVDSFYVGVPQETKCVEFEVGKQIVPIDAIYSYPDADYYALPDHIPGWHTPVIDCVGCHLPWGTKDTDQDAVPDQFDLCPDTPNPDDVYPVDTDGDGIGDSCGEVLDEHEGKFRYGKNLFYHSFPMQEPDVISHGDMLNLKNAYGLLENARRLKMGMQKIFDPERDISEQVTLGIYYKQGMNGQGAPADGFLRVFRGGYDILNAEYPLNLTSSTVLSFKIDPNDTDYLNGHKVPKVEEFVWTNDNLYDDSGTFLYQQATDEFGYLLYDENGYPIYDYDPDTGDLILPTDSNGIAMTYCNPYENVFSARIAIRGDRIIIANAHCPNWAAARKAKDTYNFYTRVSNDGGLTWDLPVNVTGMENAEEGVSDCRLVVPLPGIADSPYAGQPGDQEVFDPDTFFIVIGTQLNTAQPLPNVLELEEGEVFLDVFYTRTRDFGKTFETVTWENSNYIEGSLPYLDANGNETADETLAVKDNPSYPEINEGFDWLAKGDAAQGDVQAVCSPDGSRLYGVWEHELEIAEENVQEHFHGADVWFRRVTYDNIAPLITVPDDMILEATSPDGAVAEFEILSIDLEDPDPEIIIEPVSGTVFPIGDTTVTVTAIDDTGNVETETFNITVVDTTAPELTVPEGIVVLLNTPDTDSSITTFLTDALAVDIVDQNVEITNNAPTSYDIAARNDVTFTATDEFGNQSSKTASISVKYAFNGFFRPLTDEDDLDTQIIPIKYGKIVPVKFELFDFYGQPVPDLHAFIHVIGGQGEVGDEDPLIPEFVGNEDIGCWFRYVGEQYVFNLSTQGPGNPYPEIILGSGVYTIKVYLDDGTIHTTPLHLKR